MLSGAISDFYQQRDQVTSKVSQNILSLHLWINKENLALQSIVIFFSPIPHLETAYGKTLKRINRKFIFCKALRYRRGRVVGWRRRLLPKESFSHLPTSKYCVTHSTTVFMYAYIININNKCQAVWCIKGNIKGGSSLANFQNLNQKMDLSELKIISQ